MTQTSTIPLSNEKLDRVGVVVIGRNEGKRLETCLGSILGLCKAIVYVDSGSTDGSVEMARSLGGVDVVELDMSEPFSMSRGRNSGWKFLASKYPLIQWIQFVDGDCEMRPGWIPIAIDTLDARPELAAVFGRLRERDPGASLYNRLADIEWKKPRGEVKSFGGIVMICVDALVKTGGYNPVMIAGEEAELSLRILGLGRKILCLDEEMCLHDIAMTRFSQWWMRCVRTGYAYAHGASIRSGESDNTNLRRLVSAIAWGIAIPVILLLCLVFGFYNGVFFIVAVVPLILIGINGYRTYMRQRKVGISNIDSLIYAGMTLLSKIPQSTGAIKFAIHRARGGYSKIIDYKKPISKRSNS